MRIRENARLRQAAAAKAEEQQRQLMRDRQNSEEKAKKAREEQLKREEKEQLVKEKARLAREEQEEQMSRERQQRMVWEEEKRHTKESYQYARTGKQRGGLSKSDKQGKKQSRNDTQRHGRESEVKREAGGKGCMTQQKSPFKSKSKTPATHRKEDSIDVNENRNCKHRKFWTKVAGRIECGRCLFTQNRFAFRCPECQLFACASCRDLVKKDSS